MRLRSSALLPAALLAGAALALPTGAAADTAAVSERPYEDTSVGFSVLPLRGWEAKPRKNPDDPTARLDAGGWYARKREEGAECTVLKFGSFFPEESVPVATEADAPPGEGGKPGGEGAKPAEPQGPRTVQDLIPRGPENYEQWLATARKFNSDRNRIFELEGTKAKFGPDEGLLLEGEVRSGREKTHLVGAVVKRGGFEVLILYEAPDGKNYVRDYKGAFKASSKSLRILPEATMRKAREALAKKTAGAVGDAAWAEEVIAGLPRGWTHHRTDHYVIVYDKSVESTNPGLVKRIAFQLETLRRDVYEVLFPPSRPVTALSVVKVTQDPQQYLAYGAPPGSAGYWSWVSRELVFFCKKDEYDLTLDVLNHEAFHQYIFYAVGQVSPHSWFNEGHGDFFAGYDLVEGKMRQGKFQRRLPKIRAAVEERTYVPLKEFVKYSQQEYYRRGGSARKGEDVLQNYAQGWSLVWFLRTTKDAKYRGVLDRYFVTLKAAVEAWRVGEEALAAKEKRAPSQILPDGVNDAAMEAALKAAFEGVDMDQLEKDWIASKPY